uniref:Uncharacterized protein n=1 Tax=Lotharella globosa TaxID=91324 RepID=A0A7S3YX28_9EUKA
MFSLVVLFLLFFFWVDFFPSFFRILSSLYVDMAGRNVIETMKSSRAIPYINTVMTPKKNLKKKKKKKEEKKTRKAGASSGGNCCPLCILKVVLAESCIVSW